MSLPLPAREDAHGGMVIFQSGLPADADQFHAALQAALRRWRSAGKTHVWLTLPRERAALIPAAVEAGFAFHHTQEDALTLVLALQPETVLPHGATHRLGVSAAVISARNHLLVVRERHSPRGHSGRLTLPTGPVAPDEHLVTAAQRIVQVDLGVETYFVTLVGLQHEHGREFGASHLHFVALLRPLELEIRIATDEIADAHWLHVDEFLDDPEATPFVKRLVRLARSEIGWSQTHISGYSVNPLRTELIVGSLAWERRHRVSLLFVRHGRVLLIKRERDGQIYYITPGGGVESGETFRDAAVREGREETGLTFTLGPEISAGRRGDQVEHVYLVTDFSGEPQLGGPELERASPTNTYTYVWVPLEQVNDLVRYPGPVDVTAVAAALRQ